MKVLFKYKLESADDTILFGFELTDEVISYIPGQFAGVRLDLKYPDDKGSERYFSIVNPPDNGSTGRAGTIGIATRISAETIYGGRSAEFCGRNQRGAVRTEG